MKKCLSVALLVLFIQVSFAQVDGLFEEHFDDGQLKTQGYYKDKNLWVSGRNTIPMDRFQECIAILMAN